MSEPSNKKKFPHYFKDVSTLSYIDVYRVLQLFEVSDPCVQHAVKKLLVSGQRGSKDILVDLKEAVSTLNRKLEMLAEDKSKPVKESLLPIAKDIVKRGIDVSL